MSGTTWTKFFWSDWLSEPALRQSSYSARGLWMDMLCIAASHDPIGYVSVAGRGLSETDIARMTGGSESEVHALLVELERNGVFSRDRKGTIYSRRMVSDAKKAALAKKNGKNGGNPKLCNKEDIPALDKGTDNGTLKPHKPPPLKPSVETSTEEARASSGAAGAQLELIHGGKPADGGKPDWWPQRDRYDRVISEVTDKLVYQVGKAVLGDSAGGLITRLRKCHPYRRDLRAAVDLLLRADAAAIPREWFGAALRDAETDQPLDPMHVIYPESEYRV